MKILKDRGASSYSTKENSEKSALPKYNMLLLFLSAIIFVSACGNDENKVRAEYSSPEKAYANWLNAGVAGDLYRSTEALSEASERMMDQMAKNRNEFMKRMVAGANIFKTYSIVDKRISGDKALILIESPDKKQKVPIPLLREKGEWKVDLIKMFGG